MNKPNFSVILVFGKYIIFAGIMTHSSFVKTDQREISVQMVYNIIDFAQFHFLANQSSRLAAIMGFCK